MRKSLLFLCVLVLSISVFGQTADLGYINPKLGSGNPYSFLRFGTPSDYKAGFMWNNTSVDYGDGNDFSIFTYNNRDLTLRTGTGNIIMFPTSGGNVGIGTTSPGAKLDVKGTIKSDKLLLADPNDTSDWNTLWRSGFYQSYNATNVPEPNQWFWGINMNHSSNNPDYKYNGQIVVKNNSVHPKMYFRSTNKEGSGTWARVVHSIGNQYIEGDLGIGTTNPDAKLAVNGNIHTKEVKVDLIGWADYVFTEDYNLPTLEQVEDHIATKGHLINIPSAAEVAEHGIQLGEMNAKLLEKIEELTLYTIAQEKKLNTQQKEIEVLKKQNTKINDLEQKLNTLLKTK
ncbi:pyocin knob domain-containing protein [uncultured Aquimarina sp.]|uniref:pyocin knob domain-containing protein n=1 Tax=uncultured Aquimarina sp. TaxID=575652 RepID=UPI002638EB72|nr:pyocin knob domain-containing protein [uncultured Aquimarina sp.]